MAAEVLHGHGIDLGAELSGHQGDVSQPGTIVNIVNASLPTKPRGSTWDIGTHNGLISSIRPSRTIYGQRDAAPVNLNPGQTVFDCGSSLVTPSLCHPHIHLDKAFLLSHPSFSGIQIQRGDFAEAMELTSKAKSKFQHTDLIERGQRLIDESVEAGVTHMRAFVEIDAGVGMKCLEAGLELKRSAELAGTCKVQICAFAQLPLFTKSPGDEDGAIIRGLVGQASGMDGVDAIGSTPYVEANRESMEKNIEYMVDLSMQHDVHLDFHLDYNLDASTEPMIWHVLRVLKEKRWPQNRTVVLGHCTRLTLFLDAEWQTLRQEISDLPVFFVGLPTSDLFMMRTPNHVRGTLNIPNLIREHGLNACIGMNNIGNAFTPHGSCDPVTLACNGVGIYQTGTVNDAELLYACISTRAKRAIGFGRSESSGASTEGVPESDLELRIGDKADLLVYGSGGPGWHIRRTVSEAVYLYDNCSSRRTLLDGIRTK